MSQAPNLSAFSTGSGDEGHGVFGHSGIPIVTFDAHGRLTDCTEQLDRILETLADRRQPVTDVFVFSHGWLNSYDRARGGYDRWLAPMRGYAEIRSEELHRRRPGLRPLVIGMHWPSRPFAPTGPVPERAVNLADAIGDASAVEEATVLLERANAEPDPTSLSDDDVELMLRLDAKSQLGHQRVGAAPGSDRASFRPEAIHRATREEAPDLFVVNGLLQSFISPLFFLSFWAMKRRALKVGSFGVHELLGRLQLAADPAARFHLIGHSFGAVVCSAAVQGPQSPSPVGALFPDPSAPLDFPSRLPRPVHSLVLAQGAMSLWSFAPKIPEIAGPGYFTSILDPTRLTGPLVATRTRHDRLLGWAYPMAAIGRRGYRQLVPHNEPPRYGALGCHGFAGLDGRAESIEVTKGQLSYPLGSGRCYTAHADDVIVNVSPYFIGAHTAIGHAEVAALIWESAITP